MTPFDALLIVLAGVVAGVMNAVVGAGTLVTFPTLLLLGYPPVLANVSSTVGLVPGSVMGAIGYRATLKGRGPVIARLLIAAITGGTAGGALLVLLPGRAFETVIPWLLLLSAVLAAFQPRISSAVELRRAARGSAGVAAPVGWGTITLVLFTAVYGGYFGAAQGVILLVVLGLALGGPLNELNGAKNVIAGTTNLVAALLFIVISDVDWSVAALVAIGATVGGGLGGRYGRRLPSSALRVLLVGIAVIAAATRFLD